MKRLESLRSALLARAARLTYLPPLLARLVLGYLFVHSGLFKLGHLAQVTGFFARLGIPAPGFHAHFVGLTELLCGAAVLLGFATRAAVLPLAGTMVVALWTAKRPELHELSDLLLCGEFLNLVLLLWLAVGGAGPVSLDALLLRRRPAAQLVPA